MPEGAGPRLHVHEDADECIYVLAGELLVDLGGEAHDAAAGGCVFIPRGLPHRFQSVGGTPAAVLAVYTPGGIEDFFESLSADRGEQ